VRVRNFLGIICLTATAHAAAVYYDSPPGGFTFKVPAGWQIVKQPVEQYPVLFGPDDDENSPYVVITEVHGEPDLFALGDLTLKEMLKDSLNQLSVRDAFHTADDRIGIKYVIKTTMPNSDYRQVLYFVEGPGDRRFCFMATMPEAGWTKYDGPLDNMVKTFHLRAGTPLPTVPADTAPAPGSEIPSAGKGNTTVVGSNGTPANGTASTVPVTTSTATAKKVQFPERGVGK
jgi:hypothetical protein